MPDWSQRFADRVKSLFQSQKNRAKEKKNKLGRITRKGYVVPFTEKQFGDWLLLKFGAESGCVRCRYCNQPIDAYSCVIDHAVPLNRSGVAGFVNLDAVCDPCNNVKGKMTPEEMDFFLACMRDMAMKFHDHARAMLESAARAISDARIASARPASPVWSKPANPERRM